MTLVVDSATYELHVLRATADGVEPALLLKAPGKKAEYLFNVPDGFSRLALEHKFIPSARLSCVLLTSLLPRSTGGLGGLFLRLKHDGHGQVQIIGPQGSSNIAHSLRHICRWQHPKVFVSECCDNGPPPVFEDEHIVIVPLLAGDQCTGCPWCLYASSEIPKADEPKRKSGAIFEQNEHCCPSSDCSTSSSSSDDTIATRNRQPTRYTDGDSFEKRLNTFSSFIPKGEGVQSEEIDGAPWKYSDMVNEASSKGIPYARCETDQECFHTRGSRSILPQRRKRDKGCSKEALLDLDKTFAKHVRGEIDKAWKNNSFKILGEVHCGSNSGSLASRSKQRNGNSELSCDEALSWLPSTVDWKSPLLCLIPNLCCEQDIPKRISLEDTAAEGNLSSCACSKSQKSGGFSDLQSNLHSTSVERLTVDCHSSEKCALRGCDVAWGSKEYPEPSLNSNVQLVGLGNQMTDILEVPLAGASGAERLKNLIVHPVKRFDWCISNKTPNELPLLADDSNPVYATTPSGHVSVITGLETEKPSQLENIGGINSHDRNLDRILGYVCYLRQLKKALLIVDCTSAESFEILRGHPVLCCMFQTSGVLKDDEIHSNKKIHTLAAVVHLTPHSIVQSTDYQKWMQSFRSTAPHVVMSENSPEFGFCSSLTTLRKLNSIHQDIFPLPPNMTSHLSSKEPSVKLAESNVSIVDAKLCMGLKFCEGATTFSQISMDYSVCPLTGKQMESKVEMSEMTSELLSAVVEVPSIDASSPVHLDPNIVAATAMKSRLFEQKQAFISVGTCVPSGKRVLTDSILETNVMINPPKRGSEFQNDMLATNTVGGHNNRSLCLSPEKAGEDVHRSSDVQKEAAGQMILMEEQQRISLLEVSMDNVPTLQTGALVPVQGYRTFCEPNSEFQLIFLGTGSAEPSKKRGSSGILLQVRGTLGAILMDAGEGVGGQLIRRFGKQGARIVISSLQCLWLSHKHGDHALGVLSILQMRSTQASPLLIIGPHKVGEWLSEVRDTCSATGCPTPCFTFIHSDQLCYSERSLKNPCHAKRLQELLEAMQLQSMRTVKVFHCYDAYGIVLNGKSGWTVVYSGDTRPCKQLIEAGWGCTLLIHEATFEDSLLEHAKQKRHSTVSEAVQAGWHMNAGHIILTHFSQRYPEIVTINGDQNENVSLAFDGMVVPSCLLGSLGKLLPVIQMTLQRPTPIRHIESTSAVLEKTPLNTTATECPVTKHIRWLSDSDGEGQGKCLVSDDTMPSIRWSSDSEGADLYHRTGNRTKNGAKDFKSEMTSKIGFCDGSVVSSFNCLKEIGGSCAELIESVDNHCKKGRVPFDITETPGPYGGKHVRWIDSDSEDV